MTYFEDDIGTNISLCERLLLFAAKEDYEVVVKGLLEKGVDIPPKDRTYSLSGLPRAVDHGHEAEVKVLLDDDATPLLLAAICGHETVVKALLERGDKIEVKDWEGRTPLWWAARNGHEAVVKLLLEKGAETEGMDRLGRTALWSATSQGHEVVVQLLLNHSADVEAEDDRYGWTLL